MILRRRLIWPLILTLVLLVACGDDDPSAPPPPLPFAPADFVLIPGDTFTMGSPLNEPGRNFSETQHEVTLTHDYWIQTTEVTNAQYLKMAQWALNEGLAEVTGDSIIVLRDLINSHDFLFNLNFEGSEITYDAEIDSLVLVDVGYGLQPDHPVKFVSWWGAAAYCNWLSLKTGLAPAYADSTWQIDPYAVSGFRLPTEAEWEYAARGGRGSAFGGSGIVDLGCGVDSLSTQGWYCYNAEGWVHPVALKQANDYGLYDMHGNVWEMCNDWLASGYYTEGPASDPPGAESGYFRVGRGGAWDTATRFCRSAQRGAVVESFSSAQAGFRVVVLDR